MVQKYKTGRAAKREPRRLNTLTGRAPEATVEETVGGAHYDAPHKDPLPNDTGDKVEGLAKEFHDAEDAKLAAETPGQHEATRMAAEGAKPGEVPEEDRRRALLSKQTGIDLFPRDARSAQTSDLADNKA